ncbi:MAG TPA: rhodanese-like domain-containing protein [Geobacteraceae bacterium]|nr:rhodanese-like domain-containing protein [Geobacteraceae bacterium]
MGKFEIDMDMNLKKLMAEMGAIILIAGAFGLIWNRGMLYDVWSGKQGSMSSPPSISAGQGDIPMPAGLMQVKEMFDRKEAVLVDARDDLVFGREHIKGAVPMPVGLFDRRIADFTAKVPLSAAVVVYCSGYGCHDSMTIGKKLMARGYRQVFVYEGGYPEWKDAGLPVESAKQ